MKKNQESLGLTVETKRTMLEKQPNISTSGLSE
jgi:hypothetical protein